MTLSGPLKTSIVALLASHFSSTLDGMNYNSRSICLATLALTTGLTPPAFAHPEPNQGVAITEISRRPHPDLPDKEIIVQRIELAPGAAALPHVHPGTVTGYVISGQLEFQVKGEPLLQLKTNDTFYEPAGSRHMVARNPNTKEKTVIVVFVINPKGKATAQPLPDTTPKPN